MKIMAYASTDPGRRRSRNEDSYLIDEARCVFAVADGMGGHQGGATASKLAMEAMQQEVRGTLTDRLGMASEPEDSDNANDRESGTRRFTEPMSAAHVNEFADDAYSGTEPAISTVFSPALAMMRHAARIAGRKIYTASQDSESLRGMGTTMTAVAIEQLDAHLCAHIVHAGDSRLYRLRKNVLEQVTDDHTWIAEQTKLGFLDESEAQTSKYRHVITKSIGFEPIVDVDTKSIEIHVGDLLLLCSDGLSNYFDRVDLEQQLRKSPVSDLPAHLVSLANERGGEDNITVVIVEILP
jgi:serine/threonine protein phosphatase PrpC